MIELFSRVESAFNDEDAGPCILLPLGDEISSLSAILLNEDYYSMLLNGKAAYSEVTVLSHIYLIPFKAKAWLELREKKRLGLSVDEKDIRKHKNDIMRLATVGLSNILDGKLKRRKPTKGSHREVVGAAIDEGVRDGSIRACDDSRLLATMILASYNGILLRLAMIYRSGTSSKRKDEMFRVFDAYIDMLTTYLSA